MWKRLFTTLMVGAPFAAAGYALKSSGVVPVTPEPVSKPAVKPPDPTQVACLGRIEPGGRLIDVDGPGGTRIEKLLVEEGAVVEAGAALVRLESWRERAADRDLNAARLKDAQARIEAETAYGKAQLAEAEADIASAKAFQEIDARIAEAKLKVQSVSWELSKTDWDIQERKAHVQESVLALSAKELKATEAMAEFRTATQRELDQRRLTVRRDTEELDLARANGMRAKQSYLGRDKAQVDVAQLDLERAALSAKTADPKDKARLDAIRAATAKAIASVDVASATENLKLAEARLAAAELTAPVGGRILKIFKRPGEVTGGKPILQLGDTTRMYVVAEVYETDIRRVKVGQKAEVSSYALAKPLTGTVERVGLMIHKQDVLGIDPTAATDHRVIEVRIKLDDGKPAEGLTNLQAEVRIKTDG